jgi:hypothetical protein
VEPHDERNLQLLLTPKYGFTDLHIDVPTLLSTLTQEKRPAKVHSISLQVILNRTSEFFVDRGFNVPRLIGTMRLIYLLSYKWFQQAPNPRSREPDCTVIAISVSILAVIGEKRGPILAPSPVDEKSE